MEPKTFSVTEGCVVLQINFDGGGYYDDFTDWLEKEHLQTTGDTEGTDWVFSTTAAEKVKQWLYEHHFTQIQRVEE